MTDATLTERPAQAPRQRGSSRPQVSVRPALVGATNVATIAGATAVAAGAGPFLAVAAGGLAAVGAAAGVGRAANHRQARRDRKAGRDHGGSGGGRGGGGGGRSGGSPRGRSSSAGTPGGRPPGSKPSPTPRPGASGRTPAGGKPSAGGRSGLFGGGGKHTPGNNRTGGTGTDGHRKAGSRPGSGSRSPLTPDKVAAARRKLEKQRKKQPGPTMSDAVRKALQPDPVTGRKPTAREAWRAARRQITGDKTVQRTQLDRTLDGLAAAGWAAGKVAWDRRQAKKRAEATRLAKAHRIAVARQKTRPGVNTVVRVPADTVHKVTVRKPAPAPVARRARTDSPTIHIPTTQQPEYTAPHGGAMSGPSAVGRMIELAEEMIEVAMKFERPDGVMELLHREYAKLPEFQLKVAQAVKVMHQRATDPVEGDPLPPIIMELIDELHRHQLRNAMTAEEIVPLARRLMADKIDALRDRRNRMWDQRANQEYLG